MKIATIYRTAACIVLWLLALGIPSYPVAAQDLNNEKISDINAYIDQQMQELSIPGFALGIVRHDQIVYLKGYGIADPTGRAVTPQTPFLMASISKSFTGVAIMQLVEASKIDLDAPVKQYISWFRPQDTEHPIKVSELLYHTSGLPVGIGDSNLYDSDTSDAALENEVRRLSAVDLDRPAGESFEYTNASYDVAGYLVQVVSGQSYEDYIKEHILTPLDMHHSFLSFDDALADGKAVGYYPFFGRPIPYDIRNARSSTPAAGILSSAEDMTHYLIANLNQGRYGDATILSPDGMAKLHQPGVTQDRWNGYAIGWQMSPLWGAPVAASDGQSIQVPITLQHGGLTPTTRTGMILVPEQGWGVVTLMNTANSAIQGHFDNIAVGVTLLLMGFDPLPANSEDLLNQNGRQIGIVLTLMQVLRLIGSILVLRHWRQQPESRPRGPFWLFQSVVLPALIDIALALWLLVILPQQGKQSIIKGIQSSPDLGVLLIIVLVLTLVWGTLRTILYITTLRRSTARAIPRRAVAT